MEILVAIAALVIIKRFCKYEGKSFTSDELPPITQSRSAYKADAKVW